MDMTCICNDCPNKEIGYDGYCLECSDGCLKTHSKRFEKSKDNNSMNIKCLRPGCEEYRAPVGPGLYDGYCSEECVSAHSKTLKKTEDNDHHEKQKCICSGCSRNQVADADGVDDGYCLHCPMECIHLKVVPEEVEEKVTVTPQENSAFDIELVKISQIQVILKNMTWMERKRVLHYLMSQNNEGLFSEGGNPCLKKF